MKVFNFELFDASRPDGLGAASLEALQSYLQSAPENRDARFLLANRLVEHGKFQDAVGEYRMLLNAEPHFAQARCNLAITLLLDGQTADALREMKESSIGNPNLFLPQLYIGQLSLEASDYATAEQALQRARNLAPHDTRALLELGKLQTLQDKPDLAEQCFEEALRIDPTLKPARHFVARKDFLRARQLFEQNALKDCFSIWADIFERFPDAFHEDHTIVSGMTALIRKYNEEKQLELRLDRLRPKLVHRTVEASDYWELFSEYFFSIGRLPANFIATDRIEAELEHWSLSLAELGDYPFARYRRGIALCLKGALDLARVELERCVDLLPPGKWEALQLQEILSFTRSLIRIEMTESGIAAGDYTPEQWETNGFSTPFSIRAWSTTGLSPEEAARWRDADFSPQNASSWATAKVDTETAQHWISHGFTDSALARRWIRGGIAAAVARRWTLESSLSVELSVQCINLGLVDPIEASQWLEHFPTPFDAANWRAVGFQPAEAAHWLAAGVRDPFDAQKLQAAENSIQLSSESMREPHPDDES